MLTAVVTHATGDVLPASDWNTYVRDNLNFLFKSGGVLASAGTIVPTAEYHSITGTTTIQTIDASAAIAGQRARLIFRSPLTIKNATGNIKTKTTVDRLVQANEVVEFVWDGTWWWETGQPLPNQTIGTSPPAAPTDGDMWVFPADDTNGVYWTFVYDSSETTYKWRFMGGPPLFAEVLTSENTSSSTYTALATAGPSLVAARAGDYYVETGFDSNNNTGAGKAMMSYDIGATAAVDADFVASNVAAAGNGGPSAYRRRRKTGIAAATTFTAKYRAGAGTPQFENRWMSILPIRVS